MKKFSFLPLTLALLFTLLIIESCSKNSSSNPTPAKTAIGTTLYDSLGGTALVADPAYPGAMIEKGRLGVRSVIDSTIFVIAADTRINGHFMVLLSEVSKGNLSGFTDLSENLTTFVSGAAGAKDYVYIGLSMSDAHNPAVNNRINGKVSASDFSAFISDVVTGANKNKLPANLINSVGKLLGTLQSQVVQM
jgi:hypothetical protein